MRRGPPGRRGAPSSRKGVRLLSRWGLLGGIFLACTLVWRLSSPAPAHPPADGGGAVHRGVGNSEQHEAGEVSIPFIHKAVAAVEHAEEWAEERLVPLESWAEEKAAAAVHSAEEWAEGRASAAVHSAEHWAEEHFHLHGVPVDPEDEAEHEDLALAAARSTAAGAGAGAGGEEPGDVAVEEEPTEEEDQEVVEEEGGGAVATTEEGHLEVEEEEEVEQGDGKEHGSGDGEEVEVEKGMEVGEGVDVEEEAEVLPPPSPPPSPGLSPPPLRAAIARPAAKAAPVPKGALAASAPATGAVPRKLGPSPPPEELDEEEDREGRAWEEAPGGHPAAGGEEEGAYSSSLESDDIEAEEGRHEAALEDSPEESKTKERYMSDLCDTKCMRERRRVCHNFHGHLPSIDAVGLPTSLKAWAGVKRTAALKPEDFFASASLEASHNEFGNWRSLKKLLPDKGSHFTEGKKWERCAVVGNSGSLVWTFNGEEIDGHDVVFRINQAPTGAEKRAYLRSVGRKTTFRVLNHIWSKAYSYATGALPLSRNTTFVITRCGEKETVENTARMVRRWLGHGRLPRNRHDVAVMNVRFVTLTRILEASYQQCMEWAGHPPARGKGVPSTGLVTVFGAMSLCEHVTVYGFGGGGAGTPYQYYEQRTNGDPTHSFTTEEALLRALAKAGNIELCMPFQCVQGKQRRDLERNPAKAGAAPRRKKVPKPTVFSGSGRFHGNPLLLYRANSPPPPPPRLQGHAIAQEAK